jgi:type IV pilus assembly protein PilM
MGSTRTTTFFKDKPLFGLDIGTSSIKVMQVSTEGHSTKPSVLGYGTTGFDPACINNGEIINHESIAKSAVNLFKEHLVGDITSHRVSISVPAARTFTREMTLPKMPSNELKIAVMNEAEQYIPQQLEELYLDYTITETTEEDITVYMVAVPRKIVDSYTLLINILGLETVLIEPSIAASTRLLTLDKNSNGSPSLFLDFGTKSADISIYDHHVTITGTVPTGGDMFSEKIAEALGVSIKEATLIKTKYGISLSKKQDEIKTAIEPLLSRTTREIRRMIRYYEERASNENHGISQVITTGGGANMPGLNDYLTENLRLPTRMFDPWQVLNFGKLQPPNYAERSLYMTVAGLALAQPKEVFA